MANRDASRSAGVRVSNYVGRMNTEWALQRLEEFISLTRLETPYSSFIANPRAVPVGDRGAIVEAAQVVEQILDRALPGWRVKIEPDSSGRWRQHREAAQRAVVQLRDGAELAALLGDDAPTLSANGFHPWVWEGARSLWQSGHYREAVRAAAVKLNAETQNKLGRRDTSETDLLKHAFSSDDPKAGSPRLRPRGDDGGKTALSVRRGVMAFAEGCFAGIRNPASHDDGDLEEQVALEQLAAFSVLARWIDEATLLTA